MMYSEEALTHRKPVWTALSELYLDTELQDYSYRHIAKQFQASPYSLTQIKEINRSEVFPVLCLNLISVAGVWTGFDEDWLIKTIVHKRKRNNPFKRLAYVFCYFCMKGTFKEYWERIETELQRL
ncbi:DUF7079 family protein [Maribacter sp. 2-571]|uniref:DUF7079 family protein n=1 Tax=Maribacter sp. 2-571 TaxID=3417569 RepID=UPI003D32D7E7